VENGLIKVEGMMNQRDVDKVLHALNEVWGIREAQVSLATNMATFSYDEKAASHEDFLQAVKDTGFHINDTGM
jgi:copper chaperone CopZ